MTTKPVKHFLSSMAGAPVLNGTFGALVAVLDACLVNGFNLLTLDSLSVENGVLTGTKAGHGFIADQVILIAGATQSALNGEWTIETTSANTFSARATGIADVAGTGQITVKAAAAGWVKTFSGDGKAVYRSIDPESTGFSVRVDDTYTTYARVVGYEEMTDIDTGVGKFPTDLQVAGGAYWRKSPAASNDARSWLLVADSMAFYIVPNSGSAGTFDGFGDFPSYKAGDGYRCFITGLVTPSSTPQSGLGMTNGTTPFDAKIWISRSYSQLGSSVPGATISMAGWDTKNLATGASTMTMLYPSPVDNGLLIFDTFFTEGSTTETDVFRGVVPGFYSTPQRTPLSDRDKVVGVSGITDRTIMMVSYYAHTAAESRCGIDITGPWR